MLIPYNSNETLREALEFTREFPTFMLAHYSIESEILGRFPESKNHVFFYSDSFCDKLWVIIKQNLVYKLDHMIFCCDPYANFDLKEVFEMFDELDKRFDGYFKEISGPIFEGPENIYQLYEKWLMTRYPNVKLDVYTGYFYYMTTEQQHKLLAHEIQLPEGYTFANFEMKDLESITFSRPFSGADNLEQDRAMLSQMPYSLIKKDDQVVAVEMVDPSGYLRSHFVLPKHRGKGLGNAVEWDISKKCIILGIVPNKCVNEHNTNVLEAADRSPFWTRWNNVDGKPVTKNFVMQSNNNI